MRAPFQILAIPYRITSGAILYGVLHRADHDQWQFVAGGGEDNETPLEAAQREIFEECGVHAETVTALCSVACVPNTCFAKCHRAHWAKDAYVIPEYSFAFACPTEVLLSHEHTEVRWLTYREARELLQWDSNKTALYELDCRLRGVDARGCV
ncbi:MAG: NUDIX pyrophosphatase [Clostridia bacterium]|nr:NUDIX pyrophosphatase [Clostridia bacterium]